MPSKNGHGGKRIGAGRPKGSKTGKRLTRAQRMAALRHEIAVLAAADMTPADISTVTGIPIDRLKKTFANELANAKTLVRATALLHLRAQSESGKTAATRLLLRAARTIDIAPAIPPKDAAKQARHDNIVELALKRMKDKP